MVGFLQIADHRGPGSDELESSAVHWEEDQRSGGSGVAWGADRGWRIDFHVGKVVVVGRCTLWVVR